MSCASIEKMEKIKKTLSIRREFGGRLQELRKKHRISQEVLAVKLGYKTGGSVSNIESGGAPIDTPALAKIAEVLGADLHWLITGQQSPTVKAVIKGLYPFVDAHLTEMQDKKRALDKERRALYRRQLDGEIHTLRLDELQEEIANIDGYYQAIYKHVHKVVQLADKPLASDSA